MKRVTLVILVLAVCLPAKTRGEDVALTTGAADCACGGLIDSGCCPPYGGQIVHGGGPLGPLLGGSAGHRPIGIYGGYEFGWLQPRFSNNVAVLRPGPIRNFAKPFSYSYDDTSRIWLGFENACYNGIRARYWNIDTEAQKQVHFATAGVTPIGMTIRGADGGFERTASALAGDALTASHRLQLATIDLEGTHRMRMSCTSLLASFGLRYVDMHQRTKGVATDGGGALTELVSQNLYFDGFGPTMSLELNRGLCAHRSFWNRFSWFAGTRWSFMIGRQEQDISYVSSGGASVVVDDHKQDDFLPIGEFAGGLQLALCPFDRGLWVFRTGYRAEAWWGTGGPVDADSNLGLHGMLFSIAGMW